MLLEGYIGERLVFKGNESKLSSGSDWTGTIRAIEAALSEWDEYLTFL